VEYADGSLYAVPLSKMKRFEAMARANALVEIPEGCTAIREGALAQAWLFSSRYMSS
jgi:molybdopterin biosynthesis enzyme